MPAAALLRSQIENILSARIPSALTPQSRRERPVLPTGIAELDVLLTGGLPVGAITEVVGPASSGRTTFTMSFLATIIRTGQVCAWVDASDALDPESAAAGGIDLSRLLWVRCGAKAASATSIANPQQIQPPSQPIAEPIPSGGSPHPRSEARGLPEALEKFLHKTPYRDKTIGTPGVPNRPLEQTASFHASPQKEQIAFDRLPPRRGERVIQQHTPSTEPRCAEPQRREPPAIKDFPAIAVLDQDEKPKFLKSKSRSPDRWQRIEQALRATELLMQAGGFGAVVLDLGDMQPEAVNRIPLATWFRYRAAADRSRTAFLLLTRYPCAQSSAEVQLRTTVALPEPGTVMGHVPYTVELIRQRFQPEANIFSGKKPPQRVATWKAQPAWIGKK